MFIWSRLATVAIVVATAAHLVAGDGLQVGYPSAELFQCSLAQLEWSGSTGQTNVAVVDATGATIKSFDPQPDKTYSLTWYPVDAKAGQQVYVKVVDAAGNSATSPMLTVNPSTDGTCLAVPSNPLLPSFTLFSGPLIPESTITSTSTTTGSTVTTVTTRVVSPTTDSNSGTVSSTSVVSPSSSSSSAVVTPTSTPTSSTSSLPSTSSTASPDSATGQYSSFSLTVLITFAVAACTSCCIALACL